MNILLVFGETIKEIRAQKGFSQSSFAEKIGIDRAYYASIEAGKHSASLEKIVDIANGLGISLSELFQKIESK